MRDFLQELLKAVEKKENLLSPLVVTSHHDSDVTSWCLQVFVFFFHSLMLKLSAKSASGNLEN